MPLGGGADKRNNGRVSMKSKNSRITWRQDGPQPKAFTYYQTNRLKNVWSRVPVFVVLLCCITVLLTGCAANEEKMPATPKKQDNNAPQGTGAPDTQGNRTAGVTNTPVPSQQLKSSGFSSGMYKIGQDMPAGEYKLFSTDGLMGVSYFEVSKDSTGTLESIIANDNFFSFTYVTVSDGQYFKFTDARAVPVAEADKTGPEDGKYPSGMYKVGVDIPAGEYKVAPEENSTLGYGYYDITRSSRHSLDDIVANDNFEDSRYITIQNGQYLKLNEAYIQVGS